MSHSLQVLPREGESENHHCCQSFHFLAFKRLCASVIQTITFSLPPQIGLTDSILLCADKTAGKAERCKPKSVKLGTYILRVAVTFNDTKDNGNSGGNYLATVLGRKFIGRNQEQKKVKKGADKQNWGQNQFPHYS